MKRATKLAAAKKEHDEISARKVLKNFQNKADRIPQNATKIQILNIV